jgi:molecular chaperone HtpG
MSSGIVFNVDTQRILSLLAREIYDSPLALLRENVQNAYDAVRMRFTADGVLSPGGCIKVTVTSTDIRIEDNGVGMTEQVLRENFWRAGSSGKHSEVARKAGVVGTFGIGAMANFGVSSKLEVLTRAEGAEGALLSHAERATLKVGEECIFLSPSPVEREIGTTVVAQLDPAASISPQQARDYLAPYVARLPVPVLFNEEDLSGRPLESLLPLSGRTFAEIGAKRVDTGTYGAEISVSCDGNGQVKALIEGITFGGSQITGFVLLLQQGGQLMGFRSGFGLAPIPVSSVFQFGGIADLQVLQPTAGREALSRESIDHVAQVVALCEQVCCDQLSSSDFADKNTAFMQWLLNHGRTEMAGRVSVTVMPEKQEVPMAHIKERTLGRTALYFLGTDAQVISTFANEEQALLLIAQSNPRRNLQLHYLRDLLKVAEVPNSAQVTHTYSPSEISIVEAAVVLRVSNILREDYLVPDVDVALGEISHGVAILAKKEGPVLKVFISRSASLLAPLLEFYSKAYELFSQFMKDFVRVHVYPRVQDHVPSSTRGGVDALRKVLERNRELYRYEVEDRGDLEGLLGEYLAGDVPLSQVISAAKVNVRGQELVVRREQVGRLEAEIPGVVDSPVQAQQAGDEFLPAPPILRMNLETNMKILTADTKYPQLNNFSILLGVSDRLMRYQPEFFHSPHTTRILWGGHRVIYIFSEPLGRLSLYYDIELREPITSSQTGGGMFPTTTLITQKRIYIPVPDALIAAFKVEASPKEFFVRFDILSAPFES